jgi:hypothetical protein
LVASGKDSCGWLWEILDHNCNCNCCHNGTAAGSLATGDRLPAKVNCNSSYEWRVSGLLLIPDLGSDLDMRHLLNEQCEISIPDMATTLSQACRDVVAHHLEALSLFPCEEDLVRGRAGRHSYDPRGR